MGPCQFVYNRPMREVIQAPPASRSLWQNRDFIYLWGGQVVSTLGTSASTIVYPLLILALTKSPAAAGIASALTTVPYIIFSLPVGALVDRWDRKRVMILCDIGRACTLGSIPLAMLLHALTIWQIYAACLVEGSLFVFFNISNAAALPRVVSKEQLPAAVAQHEAGFGTASILGPSLGTLLYQTLGRGAPFIADSVSYVVSVLTLSFIKAPFQQDAQSEQHDLRAEIWEGLRWLWQQPLIRYMAMLCGGLNAIGAAQPLIIIVLAKAMNAQDAQIGLIFSIAGVGGILGSLVSGYAQKRFRFGPVIIATVWSQALLWPLFIFAPRYFFLGLITALLYFFMPIFNVTQYSYRLALIPDRLQGRVNSTFRLIAFGLQPLGAALAGFLLERIGTTPTVILFSIWVLVLALATSINVHVRHARTLDQLAAE